MDNNWLLGFIEGEGCFSIGFIRQKTNRFGYQIKPMFIVKLTQSEKEVVEKIRTYLGNIGNIYHESSESNRKRGLKNANDCVSLRVTKIEELESIIKFLEKQNFVSKQKEKDFKNWVQCVNMLKKKEHLTKEGFLKIALMREQIHLRKQVNKKKFCEIKNEIDPCGLDVIEENKDSKICSSCIKDKLREELKQEILIQVGARK